MPMRRQREVCEEGDQPSARATDDSLGPKTSADEGDGGHAGAASNHLIC
jgi:hypothetical protein